MLAKEEIPLYLLLFGEEETLLEIFVRITMYFDIHLKSKRKQDKNLVP